MKFLSTKAASEYATERAGRPVTPAYLAKLASVGGGPRFFKFGKYREYAREDLDAWLDKRREGPFASTSEASVSC